MLKRNGEPCRYRVPGFAGRLTETEHAAYTEAVASVDDQLKQFNETALALSDLEKQYPDWTELPSNGSTQKAQTIMVQGSSGAPWQILRSLSKTSRNEVLFCARPDENRKEYGIIEKFDPNAAYARAHGDYDVLLTGNDPHLLIQGHIQNERAILQLFRRDIEATVEESLAAKYPGQNLSRVINAVSGRCTSETLAALLNKHEHPITHNARIRF